MGKPNSERFLSHSYLTSTFPPKWQREPWLCLHYLLTRLPNARHRPPPQDTAHGKTVRKEATSLPLIKVLTLPFEDGLNWVRGGKEGGAGWRHASNPSFEIPTASPLDLRRCKREEKSGLIDPPVALVARYPSQIEVVVGVVMQGWRSHYSQASLHTKESQSFQQLAPHPT